MQLTIQRETLLKPLQLLSGVVEKKQTLPILSNVYIKVLNHQLLVIGADMEIEITASIPIDRIKDMISFTVSASKLMDICRAFPDKTKLEITCREKKIFIKSGLSNFTLATLPVEDFPLMDSNKFINKLSISKQKLLHLLKSTSFAMAQQDVRYYLNGMLWEVDPESFHVISTDGHRMAIASTTMEGVGSDGKEYIQEKIIIPRKAVFELLRLLNDSDETLTIEMGHQSIRVSDTNNSFISKLIDGRFPDYKKVIPKDGNKKIKFDREALKSALTRISILSNEQLRAVCFQFRKEQLCLYTNNVEQETAEEKMEIEYEGEAFEIVFNVNYLLDILNVCQTDEILFLLRDSNSSILIEEAGADEKAFFVVMPMCL